MKEKARNGSAAIQGNSPFTVSSLEEDLEQLVYQAIGQYPTDVTCTFIGKSDLAVLIENIETPLEKFLLQQGRVETARDYRRGLHRAIGQRVRQLVEEKIDRSVGEVLTDRQTKTSWMGMFFLL
ncbi:MAG: Na-translocating system protein MpsC family protein [Cyanobacteria bacterium P01_A01_bin.15]